VSIFFSTQSFLQIPTKNHLQLWSTSVVLSPTQKYIMNGRDDGISMEEHQRALRRNAQRERQAAQDENQREHARANNTINRRQARLVNQTQEVDKEKWWINVARLNSSEHIVKPLRLNWNRTCKYCGIKVCTQ
jgi:hypothetical protein